MNVKAYFTGVWHPGRKGAVYAVFSDKKVHDRLTIGGKPLTVAGDIRFIAMNVRLYL